jgi:hypothetical protein
MITRSHGDSDAEGMFNCVLLRSVTVAAAVQCNAADRVAVPFIANTGEYARLYVTAMKKGAQEIPVVKLLIVAKMRNQDI